MLNERTSEAAIEPFRKRSLLKLLKLILSEISALIAVCISNTVFVRN